MPAPARLRLTAALAAAALTACHAATPPAPTALAPTALLWHGDPPFELLTESRRLAPPPELSGNRFLSGWRGWKDGVRLLYGPTREWSRLEFVHLGAGAGRALMLDLEGLRPGGSRAVRARVAGRDLAAVPLTDPLRVPLPADLPLGRVAVDLSLANDLAVSAGGLSSALPPGEAALDGEDLVESGDALVELFARSAAPGSALRLVGEFVPPQHAAPAQAFRLSVDDARGVERARFTWSALENRPAAPRMLSLPVPASGVLRVRLLARGQGPAARWRALRIEGNDAAPERLPAPAPIGAPPPAAKPPALIVVYLLDALRADRIGHLGAGPGRTPTIDRLAAEGETFAAHHSVAPNTLPSTKSLFTGRVWRQGGGRSLPPELPTLATMLAAAGYRTACVSGNENVSSTYGMVRGFDFDAPAVKFPPLPGDPGPRYNDNAARTRAAAVQWLRDLRPGERGFLYVHVIHPHNPYAPPPELVQRFTAGIASRIDGETATLRDINRGSRSATAADRERLRGLYAASLAYADGELAKLVEEATRGRAPGEVVVAVTADHGEELFDHGGLLHGYTLYEEMLHIPLVLWSPGRIAPRRSERASDTLDLFATLLALAGANPPPGVAGRSLLAEDPVAERPRFAAASAVRGGIFSVRWRNWKVVLAPRSGRQWGMGSGIGRVFDPELVFDLERDPLETRNLAGEPNLEVAWLRGELLRWMAAGTPDAGDSGEEPALDQEARRRLKALGYLGN